MARRLVRRRRRRVTWLPTNGTNLEIIQGTPDVGVNAFQSTFTHNFNTGYTKTDLIPLNPFDLPVEPDNVPTSVTPFQTLNDVIGNEYIVERIVGNCYCACISNDSGSSSNSLKGWLATVGMFVARADDVNPNVPVGDVKSNYSPGLLQNTREPWMFRRTWLLNAKVPAYDTNPVNIRDLNLAESYNKLPVWNWEYQGLMAGPFFDIRSKRRIRTDERLWLVNQVTGFPMLDEALTGIAQFQFIYDMRMLGALRRARNSSNF